MILGHMGYQFYTKDHLTEPALKIKNALKIFPNNEHLMKIGLLINNQKLWRISKKYKSVKRPDKEDYAIIVDKKNYNVLYPLNTYSSFEDYLAKVNPNIEIKEESADD